MAQIINNKQYGCPAQLAQQNTRQSKLYKFNDIVAAPKWQYGTHIINKNTGARPNIGRTEQRTIKFIQVELYIGRSKNWQYGTDIINNNTDIRPNWPKQITRKSTLFNFNDILAIFIN